MFRYSLFRLTRQGAALEGEKSAIYDCPVLPYAHGSSRGMPGTELLAASATDVPRRPKTLIPASLASAADPRPTLDAIRCRVHYPRRARSES